MRYTLLTKDELEKVKDDQSVTPSWTVTKEMLDKSIRDKMYADYYVLDGKLAIGEFDRKEEKIVNYEMVEV